MHKPILIFFAAFLVATSANAQGANDYRKRQENLTSLSKIFGELHHIRRTCYPRREADVWRNRMKKLVALEEPSPTHHVAMAAAFNEGFISAQKRFGDCGRDAQEYAAARAARGENLVQELASPLIDNIETNETLPTVWRGSDRPHRN